VIATVVGGVILALVPQVRRAATFVAQWSAATALAVFDRLGSDYPVPGWGLLALGVLSAIPIVQAVQAFARRADLLADSRTD